MSGRKDAVRLNGRKMAVSQSVQSCHLPALPGYKTVGNDRQSWWPRALGVGPIPFLVRGTCPEARWVDGNMLFCRKSNPATRLCIRGLEKPFPS